MGLYPTDCPICKKPFLWFSGNLHQVCPDCYPKPMEEDDSVLVRIKPITFDHESVYYVPVFQKNFEDDGTPEFSPTFTYSMSDATTDEQMAWLANPDYVLELRGHFKATTKPFTVGGKGNENGENRR